MMGAKDKKWFLNKDIHPKLIMKEMDKFCNIRISNRPSGSSGGNLEWVKPVVERYTNLLNDAIIFETLAGTR